MRKKKEQVLHLIKTVGPTATVSACAPCNAVSLSTTSVNLNRKKRPENSVNLNTCSYLKKREKENGGSGRNMKSRFRKMKRKCEADQNKCPNEFEEIRIRRKELAALITTELNLGNGKICVAQTMRVVKMMRWKVVTW